jgi:DNA helicase-2/ATP-dependent DNA helicase PcrA
MNYKVIGPPGTGKTQTLLDKVMEYKEAGTPLDRIGYFAFTRKAAYEARDRLLETYLFLEKKDVKHFRTLHSFAFRYLGLQEENVMQEEHYKTIGEECGLRIKYATYEKNEFNGIFTSNSEYLSLINLARVRNISVLDQLDRNEHLGKIERDKLQVVAKHIEDYKNTYKLIDYNDMIENFINAIYLPDAKVPQFEVIFIDEAQDLSLIQWKMIQALQQYSQDTYIAGDDDQAIFGWAGADVQSFIKFDAIEIPLKQSRRVPNIIHQRALLRLDNIKLGRLDKPWNTPTSEEGTIKIFFSIDPIDLSKGDWYILARTNDLLKPILKDLRRRGIYFETKDGRSINETLYRDILNWESWKKGKELNTIEVQRLLERFNKKLKETEDKLFKLNDLKKEYKLNPKLQWYDAFTAVGPRTKTYIRTMRSNGEDLRLKPRIKVLTLHSSKGGEATNVIILQNQTRNTIKGATKTIMKQDEEQRVWYVGLTRCSKNLFLIRCKDRSKEFKI